jgi:hypothetical protein
MPGTNTTRRLLIEQSLIFSYSAKRDFSRLENDYVFPYNLMWSIQAPPGSLYICKADVLKACCDMIPNVNLDWLYLAYDKVRQLPIEELDICFRKLVASSLAVKYGLLKLKA